VFRKVSKSVFFTLSREKCKKVSLIGVEAWPGIRYSVFGIQYSGADLDLYSPQFLREK